MLDVRHMYKYLAPGAAGVGVSTIVMALLANSTGLTFFRDADYMALGVTFVFYMSVLVSWMEASVSDK